MYNWLPDPFSLPSGSTLDQGKKVKWDVGGRDCQVAEMTDNSQMEDINGWWGRALLANHFLDFFIIYL